MELYEYEKIHLRKLRKLAPECTVLLKSDGTFPLEKPGEIALYGEGVRHTIKGGTGSGDVNSRVFRNVEKVLEKSGFTVTTKKWLDSYDEILEKSHEQFIKDIKMRAKKNHKPAFVEGMGAVMKAPEYELPLEDSGDVCVYVLSRNSGEGSDRQFIRGDILISETEKRDILALNAKCEKFMLVLNVGGMVDLSELTEVRNILLLSQLGAVTSEVLADLLLGKSYPSGKLATSWANENDMPKIGEFGEKDDTRYKEGIYVGYRYYDSVGIKNDFPFGFGLGYTTFSIENKALNVEKDKVTVSVSVCNTGKRPGKEVVQLYVSVPEGMLDQPYQVLAGFAKTRELAAGENENVSVTFSMRDIASFDEKISSYILEKGDYILRGGNSSTTTEICGVVSLGENMITMVAKPCMGKPDFKDFVPENKRVVEIPNDIKGNLKLQCKLDKETINTVVVDYNLKEEIDSFVDKLSVEELAYINIGRLNTNMGPLSVIGQASLKVSGAAGETTNLFEKQGYQSIVMADGPAGIRLTKKYAKDKNGKIYTIGSPFPEGMMELMPAPGRVALKLVGPRIPKDAEILDQYCIAIPIGTAVAQSFNVDLAEVLGDMVGSEMERFGVNLWLAPALNIHRDVRCGRNFEYYSEDPLVSGLFAAYVTKGVQKHKGCGTTIKHYAANNQETERYTNNSQVSERAMREIYLKGFGICVREAKPFAVMTSYNLLNGVHTSERRDLTQDILRAEFGFDGIVMTDWVVKMMVDKNAKHPVANAAKVVSAGGDLFMPGCIDDHKDILKGVENGTVDIRQLKINATRVLALAKEIV